MISSSPTVIMTASSAAWECRTALLTASRRGREVGDENDDVPFAADRIAQFEVRAAYTADGFGGDPGSDHGDECHSVGEIAVATCGDRAEVAGVPER
jgi:hypothetical protein